jgi:hypothetical protein
LVDTTIKKSDNGKRRCRSFSTQISPCQVILRSNASFAVTSLAVASLATANFFATAGFTGCSDFLSLAPLASLGFEAAVPVSDFFLIAIIHLPIQGLDLPSPEF